jgi:hypothetical protein
LAYVTAKKPIFKMVRPTHKSWLGCGAKRKINLNTNIGKNDEDVWVIFNFNYIGEKFIMV